MLIIIMLLQALPLEALASVGKALSQEELNRAYALTGLGTGGLAANGDGTYHAGMCIRQLSLLRTETCSTSMRAQAKAKGS